MLNFLREVCYVMRATYQIQTILGRNGYKPISLGRWAARPVGTQYIQITTITPHGSRLSYEIAAVRKIQASLEECLDEYATHGMLYSAGLVSSVTDEKFNADALAEVLSYRNYMLG